jgi:hypothetical protein
VEQNTKAVFGLAAGYGLDGDIVGAYRFIAEQFEKDDPFSCSVSAAAPTPCARWRVSFTWSGYACPCRKRHPAGG